MDVVALDRLVDEFVITTNCGTEGCPPKRVADLFSVGHWYKEVLTGLKDPSCRTGELSSILDEMYETHILRNLNTSCRCESSHDEYLDPKTAFRAERPLLIMQNSPGGKLYYALRLVQKANHAFAGILFGQTKSKIHEDYARAIRFWGDHVGYDLPIHLRQFTVEFDGMRPTPLRWVDRKNDSASGDYIASCDAKVKNLHLYDLANMPRCDSCCLQPDCRSYEISK